jgi:hypothetical protein
LRCDGHFGKENFVGLCIRQQGFRRGRIEQSPTLLKRRGFGFAFRRRRPLSLGLARVQQGFADETCHQLSGAHITTLE